MLLNDKFYQVPRFRVLRDQLAARIHSRGKKKEDPGNEVVGGEEFGICKIGNLRNKYKSNY